MGLSKIDGLLKRLAEAEGGNAGGVSESIPAKYVVAVAQILLANETKEAIARGLAELFAAADANFDTSLFMRAAGLGSHAGD